VVSGPGAPVDCVLAYIVDRKELEKHLAELKECSKPKGLLWIAYYKALPESRPTSTATQSTLSPTPWGWKALR